MQAVTRVKLEQASKVTMWMPTRLKNGEGRADREETNTHLFRSTGVVSTACKEGDLSQWGIPGTDGGRASKRGPRGNGQSGSRRGLYDHGGRVTLAEERTLTSGVLVKEERCGD